MTSPTVTWRSVPMLTMFFFTGGVVLVLLGSLAVAEARDLARSRRKARRA
jgi:hypothetical protein